MRKCQRSLFRLTVLLSLLFVLSFSAIAGTSDIMLQGFNWDSHGVNWYNTLRDKAADIAALGINMVWFPQPASSSGGMGYLPQKYYDLNNAVGTQAQLKEAISAMHDGGVKVLADIVINHRVGVNDWADFESPSWGTWSVCSDDEWGQGTGNPDTGDKYEAGRDLDHRNETVQTDIKAWLNWLKDSENAGFDGWRYDYSKGYSGDYVKMYNEASSPYFSVGEYWPDITGDYYASGASCDYHRQILSDWVTAAGDTSSAFDFTTKWQLQLALERGELWRLGSVPGLIGWWGNRAVTFIDNHDTGSTQGHWPFPGDKVMQGYAYILTHPGVPCIFWDHLYDWGHYDAIKALIQARRDSGVVSDSVVSVQKSEANVYAAIVGENLAMKIGSGSWTPSGSEWTIKASGTDYAVWTKGTPVGGVSFNPTSAVAGQDLTVTYDGTLKDSAALTLRWGYDGFQGEQTSALVKQADGKWKVTVTVPAVAASKFDCTVSDGSSTDDNKGAGYHADVTSNETVTVTIQYAASWSSANIHYKSGSTWTVSPGEAMTSYRSGWFTKTIQRNGSSLEFVFNDGTTWDNNNDSNYTSSLTNLWVQNGTITAFDPATNQQADVVFNPASPAAGQQVTVTYNGSLKNDSAVSLHWGYDGWKGVTDSLMTKQADGSWLVTVTVPAAAETKLDAVFKDSANNWDNNSGSDYSAQISTGGDTQAPVVALTAPAGGDTVSGTMTVSATASDNVGVAKVDFYVGGSKVGEDFTAPYSITVDPSAIVNGPVVVKATAYDAAGNSADATVNVTLDIDKTAPVVSFVLDQSASEVKGVVTAAITATDNKEVAKVELFVDGVLTGTDSSAAYAVSFDTTTISNGSHTLKVLATDTSGNSAFQEMAITVNNLQGPVLKKVHYYKTVPGKNAFLQYKQGSSAFSGYPGEMMVVDSGNWRTWEKTLPADALTVRFNFSGSRWDYNGGNNYTFSAAEVWIKDGQILLADPDGDNEKPVVSITAPAVGITVSSNVAVSVSATDNKEVVRVEFYVNGVLAATDTTAPFAFNWDSALVVDGPYTLMVKAYDASGNVAEASNAVTVYNQSGIDTPPVVTGLQVPTGVQTGSVTVTATATDDKSVSKVSFYLNASLVGEVTTAPYTVTFNTAGYADGSYTVKAIAYDSANQTAEKTNSISIYNPVSSTKPYSTNPTVGKYVPGGIAVDGANGGEWTDDMLIAVDMANDDPRTLGSGWSMHETPWDMTHLWACWDDNNLYIAWQYVDVTDIIDPANAGSSAGTKVFQMNLIQWIAFDTVQGQGSAKDMWGKNGGEDYWTGADLPDYQIYVASNLWQGFISKAVNNVFVVDDTDPTYYQKFIQNPAQGSTVGTPVGTSGINMAWGNRLAANNLWGVRDCDDALTSPIDQTKVVDFKTEGHDGSRDTFYELKIPLAYLGITRSQLETSGIGIMLGQGEFSSLDTLPNDPATTDTVGVTDSNSPKEWEDTDAFTVPFARIGHLK